MPLVKARQSPLPSVGLPGLAVSGLDLNDRREGWFIDNYIERSQPAMVLSQKRTERRTPGGVRLYLERSSHMMCRRIHRNTTLFLWLNDRR